MRRPSHATVVAYLALFVAVGGSAYAAATLSPGSVHARHLATGAVSSRAIADRGIAGRDVAPGSLSLSNLHGNVHRVSVAAMKRRAGTSKALTSGSTNRQAGGLMLVEVFGPVLTAPGNSSSAFNTQATCNPGTAVVGAYVGSGWSATPADPTFFYSYVDPPSNSAIVQTTASSYTTSLQAVALCVAQG